MKIYLELTQSELADLLVLSSEGSIHMSEWSTMTTQEHERHEKLVEKIRRKCWETNSIQKALGADEKPVARSSGSGAT